MLSFISLCILSLFPPSISCSPWHHRLPSLWAFNAQHGQNVGRDAVISVPAQVVNVMQTSHLTTTSAADTPLSTTAPFLPPNGSLPTPMPISPRSDSPLVMAYYPDWVGSSFPPENIDFSRFDWIDFAFALPDQNFNLTWDEPTEAPSLLRRLVNIAHLHQKKVKLSVGGWTGSKHFSSAVANAQSRQVFAQNMLEAYTEYGLDGIDIDWEYPGQAGNGGNEVNAQDTMNYLLFLQHLRTILPPSAMITAAVQPEPFVGSHPNSIPEFAKVLDWVLIMNYDVWGSSQSPGPNAPLYNACHNSTQPNANAVSAFNAWTSAGFPVSKLVLGLPSYGYISKSLVTRLRTRSRLFSDTGKHSRRGSDANNILQVHDDNGSTDKGQIQFRNLVSQGALIRNASSRAFTGGAGFERIWDECSSTPFLRSAQAGQIVTYDDPESLGMKAAFAKKVGMKGVNMFDVHGDTDEWELVDAVRKSMEI